MPTLKEKLDRKILNAIEGIPGETGRLNDDGSYTIRVEGTLDEIYFREYGDPSRLHAAINQKVKMKARLPVRAYINLSGRYEIIKIDPLAAREFMGEAAASANIPAIVADAVDAIWNGHQLKPGRIRGENGLDLLVRMEELPYPEKLLGGADTIFDLTTAVAAIGSGKKAWVVISVDPATNELSATNGADADPTDELTWADACAIIVPTDEIPLAAYMMQDGDTTLPNRPISLDEHFYVDLRPWLTLGSAGGGTMDDFTVAGDSGTPQTVSDGDTLTIAGGTGLSSVVSATDTVTLNLDNTAVTPASYTNTDLTVDAQGRITAAANGTPQAPTNATYITQTPSAGLSAEQAMSALATGIVKNTTTTGVQSIAAAGTDYLSPTGAENFSNKTSTNKLTIDGSADEIQLHIQGNATQTTLPFVLENSAGVDQVTLSNTGAAVFNEAGNDADFRVEGDTDTDLIHADASTDRVGIGTATPAAKLDVRGAVQIVGQADETQLVIGSNGTQTTALIQAYDPSASTLFNFKANGSVEFNEGGLSTGDFRVRGDNDATLFATDASADSVGVGNSAPDASAKFEVFSTAGGLLVPRMTQAQRDAIGSPANGLVLYNTSTAAMNFRENGAWEGHGTKFAVIEEQQAQNTAGGGSTATTWTTRVINTEVVDADGIVTISSNKFTPLAGIYKISVNSPFIGGSAASAEIRIRLRNVTATSVVLVSNNNHAIVNGGMNVILNTQFTANGTDEYDIQYYTSVARATNGLGIAVNETSAVERYTSILLEKIG